jgi:phage/plasmid-like protein (TIGR03299 family)
MHNLEIRNGKASFAAVGQVAWHGLGTYVQEAMTAEEAIKLGRLDYEVVKKPITIAGGGKIPGYWATMRTDTKEALGIVSEAYHVVQNTQAFDFFDSIIDKGEAIFHTAGVLGKGERIFITAKLPTDILVHGEEVNNYLLLTSGHDGKSAIQIGFTPIRVVCNNTLTAALRGLQNKYTILHFSNAKSKLNTAAEIMGLSSRYTTQLNDAFNRLADTRIDEKQLRTYIESVMSADKALTAEEEKGYSKLFEKKVNSIVDFALTHDTQQTEATKGTVWGAYNAISGYYGWMKDYKSADDRMTDIVWKNGSKKIQKAFELAVNLAQN